MKTTTIILALLAAIVAIAILSTTASAAPPEGATGQYFFGDKTLSTMMFFCAILLGATIVCERMPNNRKIMYQVLFLLTVSAIGMIAGMELMTRNIWCGEGYAIEQFPPLGWALIAFGVISFLILIIKLAASAAPAYDYRKHNGG